MWTGIKELVNIKPKTSALPTRLVHKVKLITDDMDVVNHFNDYFSGIADNILKGRKYHGNKLYSDYLKSPVQNSFVFFECDVPEVEFLITALQSSKSSGPNSIPVDLLKLVCKDEIAVPLSKIFNLSMNTGTHPELLRTAMAIPIFKKGPKLEVGNYRPISLLSNINKLLEKIIHKRVYKFLEKYKILYKYQFGFRLGHSTNHALVEITEKIRKALDAGDLACGIFIDLQKAFDTVNHDILLNKLEHYGLRGTSNCWFKSYLSNRKQFVSINGTNSSVKHISHGVPQGSVLGPLLFLIYINDLHHAIKYSHSYHFADDTNLLNISSSMKKIQKQVNIDLKLLFKWLLANKISLNCSKTELIIFQKPGYELNFDIDIRLNGHKLTLSNHIKYLGIYLDKYLNGHYHAECVMNKLIRANGMLSKIRHFIGKTELKSIYHSTFESHLRYGTQVWYQSSTQEVKKRIFRLQKKALRIMSFSDFRAPSSPLFKEWDIMKIEDLVTVQNCLLAHDFFKGALPESFEDFFKTSESVNDISTRMTTTDSLWMPYCNSTTYGLNSISSICIHLWNKLASITKSSPTTLSRIAIKNGMPKYFIDSY